MHISAVRLPRSLTLLALFALTLLVAAALPSVPPLPALATTAPAFRVKDIFTAPHVRPSNGRADTLTIAGTNLFFVGRTERSGTELWVSDGTTAGTHLVKDIFPGPGSARPGTHALGASVLFSADDGTHGYELWKSDGTAAGTRLVKDLAPGQAASGPRFFTLFHGAMYFAADGPVGPALWRSDGTDVGTVMVADLDPVDPTYDYPSELTLAGDTLFFVGADHTRGRELWKSDGTTDGTVLVKDIVPGASYSSLGGLMAAGNRLIFTNYLTNELWASDGTAAGTIPLAPVFAQNPLSVGERVFFDGNTSQYGHELWVSDGTPTGTHIVTDLSPGTQNTSPSDLTLFEGDIYFISHGSPYGAIWRSDGTPEGTTMVFAGAYNQTTDLHAALGRLFFSAGTVETGGELWTSDGTVAGTFLLQDLLPGPNGGSPGEFTEFGGRLFFTAFSEGRDLWATDGTAGGTSRVAVIDPSGSLGSQPAPLITVGSHVLFGATADAIHYDLYTSDGTAAGTQVLTTTFVLALVGGGGQAYLLGSDGLQHIVARSDGTPGGTLPLSVTETLAGTSPGVHALGDRVLYAETTATWDAFKIWVSDPAGTTLAPLATIPLPGYDPMWGGVTPYILDAAWAGDTVLVLIGSGGSPELWRCPGGGAPAERLTSFVGRELEQVGGKVLFSAADAMGTELWVSDGTVIGTARLADIAPGNTSSAPASFTSAGGRVYFSARDAEHGRELWVSDGTTAGTVLVRDVVPGPASSEPSLLTTVDGKVFFRARDAEHGRELWVSDGTAAGTALVRDIMPGPGGSLPSELASIRGQLVFAADDGESGYELWRSDGTAAGTALVQDIVPGLENSNPAAPIMAGNLLFFSAEGSDDSRELWALPLESLLPPPTISPTLTPEPPTSTPTLTPEPPTSTPTLTPEPAAPGLLLNYALGRPGSTFLMTGSGYPPGVTLTLTVNGVALGEVVSDQAGGVAALLRTAPRSPVGVYHVSVAVHSIRSADVPVSAAYILDVAAPLREAPASPIAVAVTVPADLATMHLRVYVPLVMRR
jgi:ELWxxDGT repeat protein